jgi:hypothetical protein
MTDSDPDAAANPDASVEGMARKTVDNLLAGKVKPKTVEDLGHAVKRAVADRAITRRSW